MVVNLNRGGVRMATKTEEKKIRLFVVEDVLVLMHSDNIIGTVTIDDEILKEEIKKQAKIYRERPVEVFTKSVEAITSIKFQRPSYHYEGKSIHDSSYYKKFFELIKEELEIDKRNKRREEIKEGRMKDMQQNSQIRMYEKDFSRDSLARRNRKRR